MRDSHILVAGIVFLAFTLGWVVLHGDAAERTGTVSQPLTGGGTDADTLTANVVVGLSNGNQMSGGRCTGILLTPTLVLTARHCITGTANMRGGSQAGLGRFPRVWVGLQTGRLKSYRVIRSVVYPESLNSPWEPNDPKTIPENVGNDIAVLFIDPTTPVLEDAVIPRIYFAGPSLGGNDINGGIYPPPLGGRYGIAGWSRTGGLAARQVAYYERLGIHHYPDRGGQIWVRQRSGGLTFPGDSGSPIFIQRSNGQREVFGILFGSKRFAWDWPQGWDDIDCSNDCDMYVDITRGAVKDWLLSIVRDTSRSAEWRQKHGFGIVKAGAIPVQRELWWGEVDYTGPCNRARDRDCDHWYDEHDDNPDLYDPQQLPLPSPKAPWTVAAQMAAPNVVRLGWRGDTVTEFYEIERLEWPQPASQVSGESRAGAAASSAAAQRQAMLPPGDAKSVGAPQASPRPGTSGVQVYDPTRTTRWVRLPKTVKADRARSDSGGFLYSTEDHPESQASATAARRQGEIVKPYTYRVCAVNRAGRACSEVVRVASAEAAQRQQLLRDKTLAPAGKLGK